MVHDCLVDFVRKEHRPCRVRGISLDAALEAADGTAAKGGPGESVAVALASTRDDPAVAADLAEQIERLRNAIAQLAPQQREVMELHLDGMKIHEIANKLRMSEEAVKGRKKRATEKLREMLG
ncbi:MAG: sigma-70 family RNA polymerase sigma factor [Planctomycetes bacterium]|nr:sigma-70 family RNA polymerase sigma factor [Planctomycetota bacterium]